MGKLVFAREGNMLLEDFALICFCIQTQVRCSGRCLGEIRIASSEHEDSRLII